MIIRRCRVCRRRRLWFHFQWSDRTGQAGWSERCRSCRGRGRRRDPALPPARFLLSRHAVARYIERADPSIDVHDHAQARAEMIRRMHQVPLLDDPPAWTGVTRRKRDMGYLAVDDDTVFCVVRRMKALTAQQQQLTGVLDKNAIVVTVLTRQSSQVLVRERARAAGWIRDDTDRRAHA